MAEELTTQQPERQPLRKAESTLWRDLALAVVVAGVFILAYRIVKNRHRVNHDDFARCLAGKQAKMYGLYWCAHCAEQKEMFGDSFQYVPYVECGIKGSRSEDPTCAQAGIKNFPTWQFPDGSRVEGAQSLQFLSQKTGCSLP